MPTYQYACTECDEQLEAVQAFTDEPLTECPVCGGRLRKVFSAVGVVFKGSGFYKTDSRSGGAAKDGGDKGSGDTGSGKGSDKGSSDTAATPAASGTPAGAGAKGSSGAKGSGSGSGSSSGSSAGSTPAKTA